MRRTRRLLALVTFLAPLGVVAVACSFPEVSFLGTDGASPDANTPAAEAGASDAMVVGDAEERVDANDCSGIECDCDDDGFAALDCAKDASAIRSSQDAALRPGDCDDFSKARNPDAPLQNTVPPEGRDGDWNCRNGEERFPEYLPGRCSGAFCPAENKEFFNVFVPCGSRGDIVRCELSFGGCVATTVGEATQSCQ